LVESNDVVVVDDEFLGEISNLDDSVEVVRSSVLDKELPTDVDVVFHLAALSSMPMHEGGVESVRRGARVNVEGFINVIEQARVDGCETVVYASTSSIYGSQTKPCRESMGVVARTGYEASKLARERYAEYFANAHGMQVAGLRLFSVYQGFAEAEEHKGEFGNIISQFAESIGAGERPVVYGDGSQTRDFTHVDDVVQAFVLAAEQQLSGTYNVGTGESYSFNEVIAMVNEVLGVDVEPKYVENPIGELYVSDTCAEYTKLHEATGWEPSVSFEEGVRRVCEPYHL
jgi:UDP-glucose 4-epimerase